MNRFALMRRCSVFLLVMVLYSPPLMAANVFTPLLGNGTPSGQVSIYLSQWSMNDFGTIAAGDYAGFVLQGMYVTNGLPPIGFTTPLSNEHSYPNRALAIDNANRLTFAGTHVSGTSRLFRNDYPQTGVSPASPAFTDRYFETVFMNSAGRGATYYQQTTSGSTSYHFSRVNGDGSMTDLLMTPGYQAYSASNRPQILENGDIYVAVSAPSNVQQEIWKYAAGSILPSLVYSTGSSLSLNSFDVNNHGDLILSLHDSTTNTASISYRPSAAAPATIATSTSGGYFDVLISDNRRVGARRLPSGGGDEILYGTANGGLSRVFGTGDSYGGGIVSGAQTNYSGLTLDMNSVGQMVFELGYVVNESFPNRSTLLRLDPEGTTPMNPVLPDCPPNQSAGGFCFTTPITIVINLGPGQRRPLYYDPPFAVGYRYISDVDPFTGVEIPFAYGNGIFDLFLYDPVTGTFYDSGIDISTGPDLDFTLQFGAALSRFALFGIEESAQVDPTDPLGFVTGLTFLSSTAGAQFFMIPVTAAIPEPSTYALLLIGLGGVFYAARYRRKLPR